MLAIYDPVHETKTYAPLSDDLTEEQAQRIVELVTDRCRRILIERIPVADATFSVRAMNALRNSRIRTLGELSEYDGEIKGAGRASAEEYKKELEAVGLPVGFAVLSILRRYRHQPMNEAYRTRAAL